MTSSSARIAPGSAGDEKVQHPEHNSSADHTAIDHDGSRNRVMFSPRGGLPLGEGLQMENDVNQAVNEGEVTPVHPFNHESSKSSARQGGPIARSKGSLKNLARSASGLTPQASFRRRREGNKAKFVEKHGEVGAAQYVEQTAQIRMRINQSTRQKRYVLHPGKSKFLGLWDTLSSLALLYTVFVTPFEAAFVPPVVGSEAWSDGWFVMNRILDTIFFIDMCLQFFVAYQSIDPRGVKLWVETHTAIIHHYLMTWFLLDATTIFVPLSFDLYQASMDVSGGDNVVSNLSVLRVLRVVRLVKLVRLVRASRMWARWKTKITLSYSSLIMLQCAVMILVASHWYACIFALQAALNASPATATWLGLYGFCDETLSPSPGTKPLIEGCVGLTSGTWYLASLSWSVMILTGTGGTDFYPSYHSETETLIVMLLILFGAMLWTRVLAMFCDVATNSAPGLTYFHQQLDGLNEFITTNTLPPEMARRLREYCHQMKGVLLHEHAAKSIPNLSPALQIEVVLHCHRHWLNAMYATLHSWRRILRDDPSVLAPPLSPLRAPSSPY